MPSNTHYIAIILINLTISLCLVYKNKRTGSRTYFAFFTIIQCFWALSLMLGYHFYLNTVQPHLGEFFIRSAYGFGALMPSALIYFFLHFPNQQKISKVAKATILPLSLFLFFTSILTDFIHSSAIITSQKYSGDILGSLYPAYIIIISYHFFLGFYFSYKSIKNSFAWNKLKAQISAISAGAFLFLLLLSI